MSLPPLYHLHPMLVHFPIALLLSGVSLTLLLRMALLLAPTFYIRLVGWLGSSTKVLFILGALAAWLAVGTGKLAHNTVPHVPNAWEVQAEHEESGELTAIVATLYAFWLLFGVPRIKNKRIATGIDVLLCLAIVILVTRTGYLGARLVFHYGVAVQSN